jgi:hypothetical protein
VKKQQSPTFIANYLILSCNKSTDPIYFIPGNTLSIFETFWGDDLMSLFAQFGMPGPMEMLILSFWFIIPIVFGIKIALRKHYSPYWMLLGLFPVAGWTAFITLCILPSQKQCPNPKCQNWIPNKFLICPYCHTEQPTQMLGEFQNGQTPV